MNINLDYNSRMPIYEQIIEQIERFVALGILKPGEQIPSIRDMACQLGINPNTVKKAYSELEKTSVIRTFSTKGTFICEDTKNVVENKIDNIVNQIHRLTNELETLGLTKAEVIKRIR